MPGLAQTKGETPQTYSVKERRLFEQILAELQRQTTQMDQIILALKTPTR